MRINIEEEKRTRIIINFLESELQAMHELQIPEEQLTAVKLMLRMQQLKLDRIQTQLPRPIGT